MEHDRKFKGLLQKLRKNGLTLNFDNCQFDLSEIDFMGYLLFARGICPDKSKIEALRKAR